MRKNLGLPDLPRHHVYRFFDADGRLLYVGCTWNLPQRLAKHRRNKWFLKVRRTEVETFPSQRLALRAERDAIYAERPALNGRATTKAALDASLDELFEVVSEDAA